MDPHREIRVKLDHRQKPRASCPWIFQFMSQPIPFLREFAFESFVAFCFSLTQLVRWYIDKQWLIQELVLKETSFPSNPLSQCYFVSRTHDSHSCSQSCCSFSSQIFSATHLTLDVSQEPVWVELCHPVPPWPLMLLQLADCGALENPLPASTLSSFLPVTIAAVLPQQFSCAAVLKGSCLPMENVGTICCHPVLVSK